MKRILALFGFFLFFWQLNPVQACAGLITFDDTMQVTDTFVKGRIISIDDTGGNAILEVENYYGSAGAEFIIIFENSIGVINHGQYGQCGWGLTGIASDYPLGTDFYFALANSGISGVYHMIDIYYFPDEDSSISLGFPHDSYSLDYSEFSESEFLDLVADYKGESISSPDPAMIPLASALRIRTESGREYLLPPDGSNLIELNSEIFMSIVNPYIADDGLRDSYLDDYFYLEELCLNCFVFSPNYVHLKTRLDREGNEQFFLFSPTNEMLAVWEDSAIVLYTAWDEVNRFNLEASPLANPDNAVWSPDGRFLAFSDSRGLWLWDIAGEARLLLPSEVENIPLAKRFSPLGNYLAVQEGENIEYIHLTTLEHFPDGIFSPDESHLLAYDTEAESYTPIENCLISTLDCEAPPTLYIDEAAQIYGQVVWLDNINYLANLCIPSLDTYSCELQILPQTYPLYYEELHSHHLFAYQEGTELVAILSEDGLIDIRKREFDMMREIMQVDVSVTLDSPVTEIEWMPSFFYYMN